jgi:hypothetical protein
VNFPHSLVRIRRQYGVPVNGEVPVDDDGVPVPAGPDLKAFQGWLQPAPLQRRLRETGSNSFEDSGVSYSSADLFAPISMKGELLRDDLVRREPPDGHYWILPSDASDAAGMGHHLEALLSDYHYPDGS